MGLRSQHFPVITNEWPKMDWFEAISENFMDSGGRPVQILEKVRSHYPIALHGTSLSIGSADPLRPLYLERLKNLVKRIDPFIVSDHLCWSSIDGEELHDLLPLPFTEEAIRHIVERVGRVQEHLGRKILLENVSSYVTYRHSVMPEWEFLREVAKRSGCGILLDINNIYVNANNHNFDPREYIRNIPGGKVGQFHLAGHTDMGKYLFDTHTGRIIDPVWELYDYAMSLYGQVSTLVEWDEDIPEFSVLVSEADRARAIHAKYEAGPSAKNVIPENKASEISAGPALPEIERSIKSWIQPEGSRKDCPLNPQGGDPWEVRLEVYSGGYGARIHESLSEAYEAVKKILGVELFWSMAQDYAARYPSRHYNLNYAGRFLPEFLNTYARTAGWPFLTDLAELEWKIMTAFHAFDEKPFSPADAAGASAEDWENARFVFQPSVSLQSSEWPVLDIWQNRKLEPEEIKTDFRKKPQHVLVFRIGTEVHVKLLDPRQNIFLQELMNGGTLSDAFEKTGLSEDESHLPQEWFQFCSAAGLIARCDFPEKEKAGTI